MDWLPRLLGATTNMAETSSGVALVSALPAVCFFSMSAQIWHHNFCVKNCGVPLRAQHEREYQTGEVASSAVVSTPADGPADPSVNEQCRSADAGVERTVDGTAVVERAVVIDPLVAAAPHSSARGGRWSSDERERFFRAIDEHGHGHWTKVAAAMGTRTPTQVRWRRGCDGNRCRFCN